MSFPQKDTELEENKVFPPRHSAPNPGASGFVPSGKPLNPPPPEHLSVPLGGPIRAASPDTLSLLSVGEQGDDRFLGTRNEQIHDPFLPPPRNPPQDGILGWAMAFWIRNKGLVLVLLAQLFGNLMNVTTRLLEIEGNKGKGLHPIQILFPRMFITVVLASAYMWYRKIPDFPFGAREVRLLLIARGVAGFFGVFGMYYSLLYLPLADATVITFLAPSLACWACSMLINEPFTRMEQIAAFISLFGVVLIARPSALFPSSNPSTAPAPSSSDPLSGAPVSNLTLPVQRNAADAGDYSQVTPAQRLLAVAFAMLGVLGAAGAYTTIRWIGKRAHPLVTVNYFATYCTIISTICMLSIPSIGILFPADLKEWCYLLFLGTCGFVMQFLLAAGLQYEKSSRATMMIYSSMLFALGFDKVMWGTTPGLLSIIGSSLILGSAIYVAVQKDAASKGQVNKGLESDGVRDEETGLLVRVERRDQAGEFRRSIDESTTWENEGTDVVPLRGVRA